MAKLRMKVSELVELLGSCYDGANVRVVSDNYCLSIHNIVEVRETNGGVEIVIDR